MFDGMPGTCPENGISHKIRLALVPGRRVDRQDLLAPPHDQQIAAGADIVEHGIEAGVPIRSSVGMGFKLGREARGSEAIEADDGLRLLFKHDGHVGKEGGDRTVNIHVIGGLLTGVGQRSASSFFHLHQP